MTWDAFAALGVVAAAVVLLVWQTRREKRVCAKCEVVASQQRIGPAHVVQKPVNSLGIGVRKS